MAALSDNNLISSHCAFSSRWFLLLMFLPSLRQVCRGRYLKTIQV
ncbi:hypothetical protein FORC065_4067 [Yersinia enterocolitica]|nr:hypothetical protein FORC065_4067 [Yersinia enterocolitica]